MKEMITAMGALIIMMVFVLQFASYQSIAVKAAAADAACARILSGKKDAEISGGAGGQVDEEKLAGRVRQEISLLWGCREEEVSVKVDGGVYEVTAPVRRVIACAGLLGIEEEKNIWTYGTAGEMS